jgi:hypothetical protein
MPQIHENQLDMMHLHEDNPQQDRSHMLMGTYDDGSFMDYQEVGIAHHSLNKRERDNSEAIIAVNDSDNEVIVPRDMEVHRLDTVDNEL